MKVLVTGGAGFIGSHVVATLVARGVDVKVLDRRMPRDRHVQWIDGDLRWIGDCDRAVRDCDSILHLAARISVEESLDYVLDYFADNLLGTVNLLKAAQERAIKRFIYTSSCAVYGNVAEGVADEEHPCNPTSPYAASKYAAERAVLSFHAAYRLPVTILRLFNVFGEGERPLLFGSAMAKFIVQALKGEDLTVHGNGDQVRDYVDVKDVAEAHAVALELSAGQGEIFNVCSGIPRTTEEIAMEVIGEVGSTSRLIHVSDPRGGAQLARSVGSRARIANVLGWAPRHDHQESLRRVIQWHRSHLAASS